MKLYCIIFLLTFTASTFAQAPDTLWTRTYGGTSNDHGFSVQQTTDNGYIVAGYTESFGAGYTDVYLIKTNSSGDTLWTKTYGGTFYDWAWSVQQTADSGYIVAGATYSFGAGENDVYLIKTNSSGDTLWTKTYGGTFYDDGQSVNLTLDGGYIIVGSTSSFGAGQKDVYLIKTNFSGDTLWTKTYGGTGNDYGYSLQQTADSGYIVAGATYSFGAGCTDVYLIKTNSSGDTLWTKTFGGTLDEYGVSVQQTTDNGYIVTGFTSTFGAGATDVYLIKTNSSGDTLWTKTYGGTESDWAWSVQQIADSDYIIVGSTGSFGAGATDVYLIKTNFLGDTLWTKTYGDTTADYGCSVQQTADNGYIIVGYSRESFSVGYTDVYLIKTGPESGVEENQIASIRGRQTFVTIFNGSLHLPADRSCRVFDITGRQIHTLDPAPGIYFIEVDGEIRQKVIKIR